MKTRFKTTATPRGHDWWSWSVRVDEPADKLSLIEHVEYILHPTFPDRIRVERNAANGFLLESAGWGEFDIVANVTFKDRASDDETVIVPLKLSP